MLNKSFLLLLHGYKSETLFWKTIFYDGILQFTSRYTLTSADILPIVFKRICQERRTGKIPVCDQISLDVDNIRKMMIPTSLTHMIHSHQVEVEVMIEFDSFEVEWLRPEIHITSEPNSFGASQYRWYDGFSQPIRLSYGNFTRIQVTDVKDTVRVHDRCSDKSYYQTLADNFVSKDFSPYKLKSGTSGKTCPAKYDCLPKTWSFNYSYCPKSMEPDCLFEAFKIVETELRAGESSKQSCSIREFGTKAYKKEEDDFCNGICFSVKLPDYSQESLSSNVWTDGLLVKTLTREYYVMPLFDLIGTVGGTLGIFIGISIWDLGSAFGNWAKAIKSKLVNFRS